MQPITPWFTHDKWMDVRDFFRLNPEYNKLMVISDNGTGKSYGTEQMVVDYVESGKHVDWIMNTEKESKRMAMTLKEIFKSRGCDSKYKFTSEGIFLMEVEEIKDNKGRIKRIIIDDKKELMVGFPYLCSFATSLPNEHKARLIVMDEFIDGNEKRKMILNDYGSVLRKGISRLVRPFDDAEDLSSCKMIMLSNPHQPEHDLIYSFGIDFDWDNLANGIDDLQVNETEKLAAYCLPNQFDIKEMETAINFCRLGAVSKNNYTFYPNKFKRIETKPANAFNCLFTYTVDPKVHIGFGWDGNKFRCQKVTSNEFVDVPHYVGEPEFIIQGYNSRGFLALDSQISAVLIRFNTELLKDNVYFDTCYTKEKCLELAAIMIFNAKSNEL